MYKQEVNFGVLVVYDMLSALAKKALRYIYEHDGISCSYITLASELGLTKGSYSNLVKACRTLSHLKLIKITRDDHAYIFNVNPKLKDRLYTIAARYEEGSKKITRLLNRNY